MKVLRSLLASLILVSPLALNPVAASAGSTVILMPPCVRAGHNVTVAAGSPITLTISWAMATRGNLQDLVNASTVSFTLGGTAVTPTTSALVPIPGPDSGDGSDGWRVRWTYETTAPAAGQTVVWTTNVTLSRDVIDHEFGLGKPTIIPAGVLIDATFFYCSLSGS